MERKRLTYLELYEDYISFGFDQIPCKELRREKWKLLMDRKYPPLEPCICCGSTVNEDLYYTCGQPFASFHRPGTLACIECERCNLKVEGSYMARFKDISVVEQWNSIKRFL